MAQQDPQEPHEKLRLEELPVLVRELSKTGCTNGVRYSFNDTEPIGLIFVEVICKYASVRSFKVLANTLELYSKYIADFGKSNSGFIFNLWVDL